MKKGMLLAAVSALALTACGPALQIATGLFGQPNAPVTHGSLTVANDEQFVTLSALDNTLKSGAVVVRGLSLNVLSHPNGGSCYTSLQSDLIYCKFGDLTPHSIGTMSYVGDAISVNVAWADEQGNVQKENLR